jgi:N-acetylglucosamine-6-sulfatase
MLTQRTQNLLLFVLPLLVATNQRAIADATQPQRPNIVFVLVDDLRHDTFGFRGHPFIQTPHIDGLAAGGIDFRNAFVCTSLCSPSRASFLTGQYMHRHKVVDNADLMRAGTVTFPQILRRAGYETAFIGKWHMGGSSDAARPGFDHWVSFRGQGTYAPGTQTLNVNGQRRPRRKYMTDELTDHAVDWLRSRDKDRPFMLYLSHKGVHGLYEPADRHRDLYREAGFRQVETMASEAAGSKPMWVHDQRNSWHGVEFPYHGRSGQSIAEMYRHYCEMVLSIDDSVGSVMEALRTGGQMHNTLVIFTSDGGHLWGEHGLIDKRCAYEESIRIPMLAFCPSMIRSSAQCDQLVANIDIAPTLLDVAGIDTPEWMDGQSLRGFFDRPGDGNDWRSDLLYEYYWEPAFPQTPTTFALRGKQFKLIQYHGVWDSDELYDLSVDPREINNLINDPDQQQRVAELRQQLYDRLKATDGLSIPLGFKRNHGANLRRADGSSRSEFPQSMIGP